VLAIAIACFRVRRGFALELFAAFADVLPPVELWAAAAAGTSRRTPAATATVMVLR
jgi:hypothetical protein